MHSKWDDTTTTITTTTTTTTSQQQSLVRCVHTLQPHLCVRRPDHSVLPQDLDQSHLGLQQGKTHTNTVTRTHSKWHEAEWVSLSLLLSSEPAQSHNRGSRTGRTHDKQLPSVVSQYSKEQCTRTHSPVGVKLVWFWPVLRVVVEVVDGNLYSNTLGEGEPIHSDGLRAFSTNPAHAYKEML